MHTGGAGAPRADAWLTTVHIGDLGLCYLDSVEMDELLYPIRVCGPLPADRHRRRRPLLRRARGPRRVRPDRYVTVAPGSRATAPGTRPRACAAALPAGGRRSSGAARRRARAGHRLRRRHASPPARPWSRSAAGAAATARPASATRSGSETTFARAGSRANAPQRSMAWSSTLPARSTGRRPLPPAPGSPQRPVLDARVECTQVCPAVAGARRSRAWILAWMRHRT